MPYASYIAGVNSAVTHFTLPETWASALVLLHRFAARNPTLLTPHTAHRLILTAFLVAMKVVSDQILSNKLVARCGGVTARNLNDMELMFLKDMDYEVLRECAVLRTQKMTLRCSWRFTTYVNLQHTNAVKMLGCGGREPAPRMLLRRCVEVPSCGVHAHRTNNDDAAANAIVPVIELTYGWLAYNLYETSPCKDYGVPNVHLVTIKTRRVYINTVA